MLSFLFAALVFCLQCTFLFAAFAFQFAAFLFCFLFTSNKNLNTFSICLRKVKFYIRDTYIAQFDISLFLIGQSVLDRS